MLRNIKILSFVLLLALSCGLNVSLASDLDWEENGCSESLYQKNRKALWENVEKAWQKLESSNESGESFVATLEAYHGIRVTYEQACSNGIYSQKRATESPFNSESLTFWDLHQSYIVLKKSLDSLKDEVDGLKRKKFSARTLAKRKLELAKALDVHGPQLKQATDDALFLLENKELKTKERKNLKRLRLAFYKLAYGMIVMRKSLN